MKIMKILSLILKKIKIDNTEKPKIPLDNSKAKVKENNSLNLNKSNTASKNPSQELKECAKVNTSIIEIKQQKSKLSNEKNKSSGKCEISKNYVQNVNLKKYYYFYAIINEEYYKKIQISLKNPNENIIPDSIVHYDYSDNFCDKKGKKQQFFTGKIKSKITFIKKNKITFMYRFNQK